MRGPRSRSPRSRGEKAPLRLISLSDGLFATVFTLLVLDLRIPDALASSGTRAFIVWVSPHFFSYLLTFIVAGTYWLAHHRDFDHIARYDRTLLGYNLLFLLFIGLLPFSTAGVSRISGAPSDYSFAWAVYGANVILAGIMLTLVWNYARTHGFLDGKITAPQIRQVSVRQVVAPVVFLVSVGLQLLFPRAFVGPDVLLVIPVGLWIVDRLLAPPTRAGKRGPTGIGPLLWRAGGIIPWLVVLGLAVWGMSL